MVDASVFRSEAPAVCVITAWNYAEDIKLRHPWFTGTWLQSFSLGRSYGFEDVQAQIDAARLAHARGFLLWNPEGTYMGRTLRPYSVGG